MLMNYVFYDFETTGTSTRYDQFHQLGAILTNSDFKELERFEIRCRLAPHIIPGPKALEITRVSPEMLTDASIDSYYSAVKKLHQKFTEWGPATYIGYNSISFDEEFMRQSFYQNLLPPFITNTKGSNRADALTMVKAVRSICPSIMKYPTSDKGAPVLKLDQLAPINGFSHANAHDAIADVEATIFITKLIRDRAPDLFNKMILLGEKKYVQTITNRPMFVLVNYYRGSVSKKVVCPITTNPNNPSEVILFDLTFDPNKFKDQSVDDITKTFKKPKRPYQRIKVNQQPLLFTLDELPDDFDLPSFDHSQYEEKSQLIKTLEQLKQNSAEALKTRLPEREGFIELEDRVYEGFPSNFDKDLMQSFHAADWGDKLDIATQFEDKRYLGLANRILYEHNPSLLPERVREEGKAWVKRRHTSPSDLWRTVEKGREELDQIDKSTELGKAIVEFFKKY